MPSPSSKPKKRTNDLLMPVLTVAVTISLTLVAIGSFSTAKLSQGFERGVTTDFQLQRLGDEISYYDEVLSMSARMAAATGDLAWEKRYKAFEPKLIAAIDQVIDLNTEAYDLRVEPITKASSRLIEMENAAFRLVREAKPENALALLFSDTFQRQKEIAASGMQRWSSLLDAKVDANLEAYGSGLFISSVFSAVSFWILLIVWILLLFGVNQYIQRRKAAEQGLRQAKQQLESNHQALQMSESALQQKARDLEHTLSELRQTQAQMIQSEKMSSLGQLVAGVAHEINNPVNFIHANLAPINEYATDLLSLISSYQTHYPTPVREVEAEIEAVDLAFVQSDLHKILSSMAVGTRRIRQIVLSLRNFSRSDETGIKSVDIHEGLESTLLILQHRLKESAELSAIEVVRNYGSLPAVTCYPGPLNQVFMNILSNAIDAVDQASAEGDDTQMRRITLRTSVQKLGDDNWVEIAIADTGLGIPAAVQARIFDAFFTTKPVGKGTGMGLSISYTIVTEKHSGRLSCQSTPGQGAEFLIQLPVAASG